MKKINIEMYNNLLPDIYDVVTPIAMQFNAEIVNVSFSLSYGKLNLNLNVYKQGGVDLLVLESIHKAVSSALDEIEDKFETDYILNVSSPGLDRLIENDDDFRRAIGEDIEVFFEKKMDDKKKTHGILISYTDSTIELEVTQKQIKTRKNYERKNITKARPFVKF